MGRLLLVELRRVLARGLTRLLAILGLVLIAVVGVLTFVFTKDEATVRAERQARYELNIERCVEQGGPEFLPPPGPGMELTPQPGSGMEPMPVPRMDRATCEAMFAPSLDDADIDRSLFHLTMLWAGLDRVPPEANPFFLLLEGVIMLPALLLLLGGMVAGASMVGAEWQAGSFTTLLTWEPRRARLLAARMVVCAVVGFVLSVAMLGLFTAALLPTSMVKGSPVGLDATWWSTYLGVVLRLGALCGLGAAVGAALAMIGRRTALAIVAVFGYLILGELVLGSFWEAVKPWLLLRHVAVLLAGADKIPDASLPVSLLVVAGYGAAVIGTALALFSRRDFASSS